MITNNCPGSAGSRASLRAALAQQLRVDSIRCSTAAGSGHPTSSMSAADLMAVLLDGHLRWDVDDPRSSRSDHLIFSKGHASPLYYAMLKAVGLVDDAELLTFRHFGSRLEGHPTPRIPPTDVATGSLGQGLPIGVGLALSGRDLERLPYWVWVLCGDSEMAEGSMWEAFQYAGWAGLDRLIAVIDVNRLGQTRETMLGWDLEGYARRAEAFGWRALPVDGHDLDAIDAAYGQAVEPTGRPTVVIARTMKGRGVTAVEDQPDWHGAPLQDPDAAIAELGGRRPAVVLRPRLPDAEPGAEAEAGAGAGAGAAPGAQPPDHGRGELSGRADRPSWPVGERVATRDAYAQALAALGARRPDIVALDGEVSNSTGTARFARAHPDRYFEMFIAEQQLAAAAVGLARRDWTVYASTFAAFWTRAHDFLRMAAVSRVSLRLVGSHAGVSVGPDGPSQMGLEDVAMARAIPGSTVLHPSDANQAARMVELLADQDGISYLRTLRGGTTVRTAEDESIRVGGSRLARDAEDAVVTVVTCGALVDEAMAAADRLAASGVPVRVLDCYSIKPIDEHALRGVARRSAALITAEDHRPEGGLAEAVLSALAAQPARPAVIALAVHGVSTSGTPQELRAVAGIDATAIVAAVNDLVR